MSLTTLALVLIVYPVVQYLLISIIIPGSCAHKHYPILVN